MTLHLHCGLRGHATSHDTEHIRTAQHCEEARTGVVVAPDGEQRCVIDIMNAKIKA